VSWELGLSPTVRWAAGFSLDSSRSSTTFLPTTTGETLPRFQGENFQKNLDLVRNVEEIAHEKRCTASQLALAWVLAQGNDIVPIPGTKRRKYLEENASAPAVKLSTADLQRINEVFPPESAAGGRYPEHMMVLVNG